MAPAGRVPRSGKAKVSKKASSQGGIPDVYAGMLADAFSSPAQVNEDGKTIKKRRIAGRIVGQEYSVLDQQPEPSQNGGKNAEVEGHDPGSKLSNQQIFDESADTEMSDGDWEDVDLAMPTLQQEKHQEHDDGELNLVLGAGDHEASRSTALKRKPITSAERKLRLEIHKMHLLCLLFFVHLRNHWCNDEKVHGSLKALLSHRTKSYLHPDEAKSQFQRSRSFNDGLAQAGETFSEKFTISARGMVRPYWADSPEALASSQLPEDLELPMELTDFRAAAEKLEASRDTGAQLFCALLRAAGVEARLVCSLQPLPFTAATPQRPAVSIGQARRSATRGEESEGNTKVETSLTRSDGERKTISIGLSQRLGQPGSSKSTKFPQKSRPSKARESLLPVFWVEAFNEAEQKWISVDPLITRTVSKPSKLEPPASDVQNNLTYVLAFEDDGFARDVTRRYAQAYNAKTRKGRVEVTDGGAEWWRKVLGLWKRHYLLPREQIEDSWLVSREAAESMPRNVLDFKDHPYYALERHLKRGEIIHPKREVGKVAAGRRGGVQILEPIFRRGDVQVVKSADKWFRMGREIKIGEQPLKRVPARRKREPALNEDDESTEESAGISLYAIHQTTLYNAPPVISGRIPKNAYGNLDIYVPTMVPAGGTHIPHPDTARAARLLGIDYSDAVTGFTFKGRHGTAVVNGAVVGSEFREAVQEVLYVFGDQRLEEEEELRSTEALRVWKRLLTGLRIMERIDGYEIEGERGALDEKMGESSDRDDGEDELGGGGFFPDRMAEDTAEPTVGSLTKYGRGFGRSSDAEDGLGGGGFLPDRIAEDIAEPTVGMIERLGGFPSQDTASHGGFLTYSPLEDRGGGFDNASELSMKHLGNQEDGGEYDEVEGGGFMADDSVKENAENSNNLRFAEKTTDSVGHRIEEGKYDEGRLHDGTKEALHQRAAGAQETMKPPWRTNQMRHDPRSLRSENETPSHTAEAASSSKSDALAFADLKLPASELAEATMLQQIYEAGGNQSPPASTTRGATAILTPLPQACEVPPKTRYPSPDDDEETSPPPKKNSETYGTEREGGSSGSEDAGSLLSHDPEDEDADPEWIS